MKPTNEGRKLVLRAGEKVSSVDYWNNEGTYFIIESSAKQKLLFYKNLGISTFRLFFTFFIIDYLLIQIIVKKTIKDNDGKMIRMNDNSNTMLT